MQQPAVQQRPEADADSELVVTPSGRHVRRKVEPAGEVRIYEAVKRRVRLGSLAKSVDVTRALASQAFKVRYKQSALGPVWLIAQPATLLGLVTLVFTGVVKVKIAHHISYPTFALVGLTVWTFFQGSLMTGVQAFINNAGLVRFFPAPRIAFVLATLVVALLPFTVMLPATFITAELGPGLGLRTLALPLLLVWLFLFTTSVTLVLATLTVRFRDLVSIVPFGVQVGLFVTPIAYPFTLASREIQILFAFNPMSGIIEGWRWAILGISPNMLALSVSTGVTVIALMGAWRIFVREEVLFADRI